MAVSRLAASASAESPLDQLRHGVRILGNEPRPRRFQSRPLRFRGRPPDLLKLSLPLGQLIPQHVVSGLQRPIFANGRLRRGRIPRRRLTLRLRRTRILRPGRLTRPAFFTTRN